MFFQICLQKKKIINFIIWNIFCSLLEIFTGKQYVHFIWHLYTMIEMQAIEVDEVLGKLIFECEKLKFHKVKKTIE